MLLTTLAFLFVAFFRMTFPSIRKNSWQMSFCDSRDLDRFELFPLGVEVWPSEFGSSNTVLHESLRATPLKCGVQVLSLY